MRQREGSGPSTVRIKFSSHHSSMIESSVQPRLEYNHEGNLVAPVKSH